MTSHVASSQWSSFFNNFTFNCISKLWWIATRPAEILSFGDHTLYTIPQFMSEESGSMKLLFENTQYIRFQVETGLLSALTFCYWYTVRVHKCYWSTHSPIWTRREAACRNIVIMILIWILCGEHNRMVYWGRTSECTVSTCFLLFVSVVDLSGKQRHNQLITCLRINYITQWNKTTQHWKTVDSHVFYSLIQCVSLNASEATTSNDIRFFIFLTRKWYIINDIRTTYSK